MIPNKTAKLVKSLHQKKYRNQYQLFLVEGAKGVLELLSSEYSVETLIATQVFLQQHKDLVSQRLSAHSVYEASESALSSLSAFKHNNAAVAIVKIPPYPPPSPPYDYVLALDDVRDPGNLGTIIRIADWYGIDQIICSEHTTDGYAPKVISASMGSFLRVRLQYVDLAQYLSQSDKPVYGAVVAQGQVVHQVSFAPQGILLMGNESVGIRPELLPFIQQRIYIPRYGQAESLNVGMATAIICDNLRRSQENGSMA